MHLISEIISENEIRVWQIELAAFRYDELQLAKWLNTDELARLNKISHPRQRRNYLISHLALQQIIQAQLAIHEPLNWHYRLKGKPYLPNAKIEFSLAHTQGLALIALAHDYQLGVDVELRRDNIKYSQKITQRYFNEQDLKHSDNFFDRWVRREALAKARGIGLSGVISDAEQWSLINFPVGAEYAAALAFNADPQDVTIRIADFDGI